MRTTPPMHRCDWLGADELPKCSFLKPAVPSSVRAHHPSRGERLPPEMVAAVSSARRRSFSSRSFSSSRWCCLCRSSIFFWCVSSMAANPRSHVAWKVHKGLYPLPFGSLSKP